MDVPVELLEARVSEYRLELAKREMQLVKYRLCLEQHGIVPPDLDGAGLLEIRNSCRTVISTASQVMISLGGQKELLMDWGAA